ncbi:MAG: MATE family efflux transporter [Ruminococcus sp.]|jgi:putative MATE family efflux protein|uniref:MATE family efflux transporter n=1 Tax=uncultured Ruminococcus sp. TaxID=165186 RepID=UPI0026056395|nr:MATE family efflux transporter [uncultured Ruminococcus sp.]
MTKSRIQISDHFTIPRLLRFVFPSIIMMIFTSIYGVVDGFFVSNYVGKTPFAAVNLIMPLLMAIGSIGFMLGTGGSALVAKTCGEGDSERANRYFSMTIYTALLLGTILAAISFCLIRPIARLMGTDGAMLEYCVLYARILVCTLPLFMLQNMFQSFFITAEKPKLGLYVILAAGISNIVLDFLFIAVFRWGLAGAAIATSIGELIGGLVPILYFSRPNTSRLKLVRTKLEWRPIWRSCSNGASEMMTNLSMSLVNTLYNLQLMRFTGEDGVAAYGVIMYVNFIFVAIYMGYSIGSAPIVGYHYGAKHQEELRGLLRRSLWILGIGAVLLTVAGELFSSPLSKIFVSYDDALFAMTRHGFRLYGLSYLLCGFNIFGSAFFTALNNGMVSAVISFARTLVFQIVCVLVLPIFLKLNGIWISILVAEFLGILVTASLLIANRKKYSYF